MNKPCFEYDDIGLSPQDMEEVYACSQGMFSGGESNNVETTEPFIIGGFVEDEEKSKEYWDPTIYGEEGFNFKNNEDYIFIRLLNTKYKNNLLPAAQLDKVIQGIDKKGKLDRVYNHCTISNYVSDYFYGLSLGEFSDKNDLHIEQVTKNDKNRLLSTGDTNSSIYTVYGIKVKNTEYASIKKFLEDSLKDPKITYNVLQLPIIGFKKIVNNLETDLNQIFKRSTEDAKQNLLKSMTNRLSSSLVCSSFVAYVIYNFTSIGKKMDVKNIKYGNLTPNDTINKIPGTEYMFSGTWNTYNSDLADFLTKNPQFTKYLKKKEGKK